ncbi:hypothetical protein D3C77_243340 [compost metagenome]
MLFHVGHVVEELVVLIGRAQTAPDVPGLGERAGDVELGAVGVPTAGRCRELELVVVQGPLAHQVDGAAGVAAARIETVDPAQELDVVVLGQVELADRAVAGDRSVHRRTAVELDVRHREATGIEVGVVAQRGAGGTVLLQGYAGGLVQGVSQGGEILILDALAGDNGHRVGDFFDRLGDLAAHGCRAGGVGAAVFGRGAEPRGVDAGHSQLERIALDPWHQDIVAVAAAHYPEVACAEQLCEPLLDAVAALQARAALALGEPGFKRQHHPGLAGKAAEHRAEWPAGDRIGARRFCGIGVPALAQERVTKPCLQDQASAEQGNGEGFSGISMTRGAVWHG